MGRRNVRRYTCICGHEAECEGYTSAQADANAEYRKQRLCWDCECKKRGAEAAEKASAAGLPVLTGSEKQATWATQLRQELVDYLGRLRSAPEAEAADVDNLAHVIDMIRAETAARWWIDRRHDGAKEIVHELICKMQEREYRVSSDVAFVRLMHAVTEH